ncbi:MAG: hypothetical protein NVS4B8_16840 [Herpetosiphon sp.]
MKERMETIYSQLWSTHDGDLYTQLDESLRPRPHTMLYDRIATLGLTSASTVLDVGSGRGNHSCELARRFGCTVVGVDLAQMHVEQGRARAAREGVASQVRFQQGTIEALPFEDATLDVIWSRDMLLHVPNLVQSLKECARVLKPTGAMLVYTTFATDLMEDREAARLYEPLGIVPESMHAAVVEEAFITTDFQIDSCEVIGSELMENVEEHEGRVSRELMRAARMTRAREHWITALGKANYEVALANYHWGIYLLLGKLSPTLYLLSRRP